MIDDKQKDGGLAPLFDAAIEDRDSGLWVVWKDGRVIGRGDTAERAIFWAGWWTGRRALGEAVRHHVELGETADMDHAEREKRRV